MSPLLKIWLAASLVGRSHQSDVVGAIVGLTDVYGRKLAVHASLCWDTGSKVNLVKSLSLSGISANVGDSGAAVFPPVRQIHSTLFTVDVRCPRVQNAFQSVRREIGFGFSRWILLNESEGFRTARGLGLSVDADVHAPLPGRTVSLYGRDGVGRVVAEEPSRVPAAVRRKDSMGGRVRICYVVTDNDTLNHLDDYRHPTVDTITKVNYGLTAHLVEYLGGTRVSSYVPLWGYKDGPSWSGMIGELVEDRADVGGTPLYFTADRLSAVEFVAMTTPTRSKFVFRKPKLSYLSDVFVLPFGPGVWLSSAALVLLLTLFLGGLGRGPERWGDALVLTVGAVCQQGNHAPAEGAAARTVTLLAFLSLMFLYTSYSANIVALLNSSSSGIRTLEDLGGSRLTLGVHDTLVNRRYFSAAADPVRRGIYRRARPNFLGLEEGIERVRRGLFAFHVETGVGYGIVDRAFDESEKCDLQEIQYLQVVDPWLAVRKNSSRREAFKLGLRKIQEHGLQRRETLRLYAKRPGCSGSGGSFVSVGLVDCRSAAEALAYGCLASVLALLAERRFRPR